MQQLSSYYFLIGLHINFMSYVQYLVNGTAQSTQPINTITNQSAAAVAACAAAAATGCPGTPSPVAHQTEPLSATAAAVFAATGIHPAAYAGSMYPNIKQQTLVIVEACKYLGKDRV